MTANGTERRAGYNLDSAEREATIQEEAATLVAKMTLEEKVLQTLYNAPAIERLGIPAYNWWNESLHGVARAGTATVFPQAITLAASFDKNVIRQVAEVTAVEGRAKFNVQSAAGDRDIYKGLSFWSPNINIFRDPRWGRGQETYGEDPWLTSELGIEFIQTLQGNGGEVLRAAACAKHYAVHSGPEDLRHEFNAEPSRHDLFDTYLPAFQRAVEEGGVESIMAAYNRVDGVPAAGSHYLLQELLRDQWGFQGHVVTDCWALKDFYLYHNVADGPVEAAAQAMNAGTDLNCGEVFVNLKNAVDEGLLREDRLDEAVARLFVSRMKLGMFREDDPHGYDSIPYEVVDSPEHRRINKEVAKRCIALLKNESFTNSEQRLLPLNLETIDTIAVIGPNADNRRALVGNYEGTASRYVTVLEGIQDYVGERARILYSEGSHLWRDRTSNLAEAGDRDSEIRAVCNAADVVIAVLGLDASIEGEGGDAGNQYGSGDKNDLNLPGHQRKVLELALESGKPIILVLLSGSALIVPAEDARLQSIIWAGYPGAQGGAALAEILFGDASPSARLPVTFYRTTEELPAFTDYDMSGRTYRYMKEEALFPFGYGLTYSHFSFTAVSGEARIPSDSDELHLTCLVKNDGARESETVVQLYVRPDDEGIAYRPNQQLRGVQRVNLAPGEEKELTFVLSRRDFELINEAGEAYFPDSSFTASIGSGQDEARTIELSGERPARWTIRMG